MEPINDLSWNYDEWAMRHEVTLEDLEVPIYPKVRTTFPRILAEYRAQKENEEELKKEYRSQLRVHFARRGKDIKEERINETILRWLSFHNYDIFLTSLKKYKIELLKELIENKTEILMKPMPKYIWIIKKSLQK